MRIHAACFVLLGLATASVIKREGERRPYYRTNEEALVADEYLVMLDENHTLESHFQFLGQNLSEAQGLEFQWMNAFHGYRITVPRGLVHDHIRFDPGVKFVEHNSITDYKSDWSNETRGFNEDDHGHLQKRKHPWKKIWTTHGYWPTRMLNYWDKSPGNMEYDILDLEKLDRAGEGVDLYIFDAGIRISHQSLNQDGEPPRRFNEQKYSPDDPNGDMSHGTAVAYAAKMTAPYINIIDVKVIGSNFSAAPVVSAVSDVIDAHFHYKKERTGQGWKGSIINMSFKAPNSEALEDIIKKAIRAGIPIITSAGNGYIEGATKPCGWKDVVCVGAVDRKYEKPGFSNWGDLLTLYAPGHDLRLAGHEHDQHIVYGQSGTSFASPMVAALMSVFINFEDLWSDAGTAIKRLKQNMHSDMVNFKPGTLANTGLYHPDKYDNHPYNGIPKDELKLYEGISDQNETVLDFVNAPGDNPGTITVIDEPGANEEPSDWKNYIASSHCNNPGDKWVDREKAVELANKFCDEKNQNGDVLRKRKSADDMSDAVMGYYETNDAGTKVRIHAYMSDECYIAGENEEEDLVGEHCKTALMNVIDECHTGQTEKKFGGGANIFCQYYHFSVENNNDNPAPKLEYEDNCADTTRYRSFDWSRANNNIQDFCKGGIDLLVPTAPIYNTYEHTDIDMKLHIGLQWSQRPNGQDGCNPYQNSDHIDEATCHTQFLAAMNRCNPDTVVEKFGQYPMTWNSPGGCVDFWLVGHGMDWGCDNLGAEAPECAGKRKGS